MTRWSFSRQPFEAPLIAWLLLAAGVLLPPVAWAHPDLLLQIEQMGERIQDEPGNPEWLIRRGDLYRRHEDYAAAARDFQAARTLAPDHPELDFYQGRLALDNGNPGSASTLLDRFLRTHPRHAVAWRLRAEAGWQQGDFASASAGFDKAIRFSDAPSPALYREWVLTLLAAGDRSAALDAVDRGLKQLGLEVTLLGLGADLALVERDPRRAHGYLDQLPAGLRQHPPWRDRLDEAGCLADTGGEAPDAAAACGVPAAHRLDSQLKRSPTGK